MLSYCALSNRACLIYLQHPGLHAGLARAETGGTPRVLSVSFLQVSESFTLLAELCVQENITVIQKQP